MTGLDELDRRLLALLQEDARRSFRTLARMAGTTPPTAAARVRRMEDAGVIEGYTVRVAGGPMPDVGELALTCHWCRKPTAEPHWATVDGRKHPFCCTTCRGAYLARHEELRKDL